MKSSYLLGLCFIISVSIIWSAASILVQYLYQDLEFDSPFLLTYIGTSLFIILIPGFLLYDNRRYIFYKYCTCFCKRQTSVEFDTASSNPEQNQPPQTRIFSEGTPLATNRSASLEQQEQLQIDNNDDDDDDQCYQTSNSHLLTHREHIEMAMKIAPWWFISNYFYNLSLKYTTITSSTVLSSTSSVFTFLLALIWGDETFNRWKLLGVVMSFAGSFFTAMHDAKQSTGGDGDDDDKEPLSVQLWGDAAGLISAVGYGIYTVLLRFLCQDESRISMNLFLGYIGFLNMIFLSPFALWCVDFSSDDNADGEKYYQESNAFDDGDNRRYLSGQRLTWFVLFCVVIKGLFDNVLSDYLWARSILLTSATVATVGLGLTIPLALLSDLFVMGREDVWSFEGAVGAMLVLFGFIFVNIGESEKEDETDSENIDSDGNLDQVSLT